MPAFFCVTGYCSNFSKDNFEINQIKSLWLPSVLINYLYLLTQILHKPELCSTVFWGEHIVKTLLYGDYWFINALILSKLIFHIISKIHANESYRFLICLALIIIGYIFHYFEVDNFWSFQQAFMMTIFLWIGHYLKSNELKYKIVIYTSYIIFITLTYYCPYVSIPYLSFTINTSWLQLPLLYWLSFSGSMLIIQIAKIINKNTILEYIGKASLIIYMSHIIILVHLQLLYFHFFDINGWLHTISFYIILIVITLILGCGLFYLLNLKCFRFILGKF